MVPKVRRPSLNMQSQSHINAPTTSPYLFSYVRCWIGPPSPVPQFPTYSCYLTILHTYVLWSNVKTGPYVVISGTSMRLLATLLLFPLRGRCRSPLLLFVLRRCSCTRALLFVARERESWMLPAAGTAGDLSSSPFPSLSTSVSAADVSPSVLATVIVLIPFACCVGMPGSPCGYPSLFLIVIIVCKR